jgi:anti-sigma factor RsiW
MHAVVVDSLEEYLSGTLEPAEQRKIEQHLSTCQMCGEEIRAMQDVSELFVAFQPEEVLEPSPVFYASVMRQVSEQQEESSSSFAGLFSLDFAFGRRLVFASLMVLALMGSFLLSRESGNPTGPSPVSVMAQENSPEFDSAPAPNNMLVTLTAAAYEQR